MKIFITLIIILLILFLTYCIIPNLYCRNWSKHVIHTINPINNQIALTFDDGPNEQYTPKVLDILKKYQVKATFFIVIHQAIPNMDLIHRMKEEGHEIAFHSFKHQSAWELPPKTTLTEISKGEDALRDAGISFAHMRPPWGTFNLFTIYAPIKKKMKIVLWSVEAYDWRKNNQGSNISKLVVDRVEAGSIIVLHDSGGANSAPQHTIDALDILIPKLLEKQFNFVTISQGLK